MEGLKIFILVAFAFAVVRECTGFALKDPTFTRLLVVASTVVAYVFLLMEFVQIK